MVVLLKIKFYIVCDYLLLYRIENMNVEEMLFFL